MQNTPVEKWLIQPISKFINQSTSSGIVLFVSALLALIISNSPLAHWFHQIWGNHFSIGFNQYVLNESLHHWINDGLMSLFITTLAFNQENYIIQAKLGIILASFIAGIIGFIILKNALKSKP